ncbi:MAG: hypothetical protein CMI60_00400 [Parvibaculum sp.]|nr:hypothetical protein [Parvibaculum sp.]
MPKAKTIRMKKNEKVNAKLHLAASGLSVAKSAIATEFNKAHADFDTSEFDKNPAPSKEATRKRLKKGLKVNSHSIGPSRFVSVQAQYEWTPEYVAQETKKAEKQNRRPYLYGPGTYGPHNPKITDAEGIPQVHEDGSQKHRWEWRGLEKDAIETYMHNCLKEAIHQVTRPDTEHEIKYKRNNRAGDVHRIVTNLERLQAYLELDYHYHPKGARTLVSKRANPYHSEHYVMREEGYNGSDSDYYTHTLLGLKLPFAIIKKGRDILATINDLYSTLSDMITKGANRKYHTGLVEKYVKNVKHNEAEYENLIKKVTNDGTIKIEVAIRSDETKRAEVTEYMKNVPHADMLNNSSLTPTFRLISLGERIKRAEERIVNSKATLAREESRVQEHTSDLPKLEYQISLMKAQNLAEKLGLNGGGEEE